MKNTKRIVALFLTVITVASMGSFSAFAANNTDVAFDSVVGLALSTAHTTLPRAKTDTSSCYVYNQCTDGTPLYIRALGAYTVSGEYTNQTANSYAHVPVGQYRVRQFIYETGRRWAKLAINHSNNTLPSTRQIYGVWSADCVGSYPAAN